MQSPPYSLVEEAHMEAMGVTGNCGSILGKEGTWFYLCFIKIILKKDHKGAKVGAGGYCNCPDER